LISKGNVAFGTKYNNPVFREKEQKKKLFIFSYITIALEKVFIMEFTDLYLIIGATNKIWWTEIQTVFFI
jgi:hypothetical protein